MRKNLAVLGSDDWTLAKPLNEEAVFMMVHYPVRLRYHPTELQPVIDGVMTCPVENAAGLLYNHLSVPRVDDQ
jgi:hypothetical protein